VPEVNETFWSTHTLLELLDAVAERAGTKSADEIIATRTRITDLLIWNERLIESTRCIDSVIAVATSEEERWTMAGSSLRTTRPLSTAEYL